MAHLSGRVIPWSSSALAMSVVKTPFTPWLSLPRIHHEALKLWAQKRLPFFSRPAPDRTRLLRVRHETHIEGVLRKRLLEVLSGLPEGRLTITLPEGAEVELGQPDASARGQIQVRDHRFFSRIGLHGDIGFGEAYVRKFWESDDLDALLRVLLTNYPFIAHKMRQFSLLKAPVGMLLQRLQRNTPRQSRVNIRAHYDLSNNFFSLMLDPTMMYSSAIFKDRRWSLEQAQRHRIGLLIAKLQLTSSDTLLEIGCGWGGFALEAARQCGCKVTAVTISDAQARYVEERVAREGLTELVSVVNADYRTLQGRYSKIISIEMLEAVGHDFLPDYFRALERLLSPDGIAVLQFIAMADQRYDRYRKGFDWIRKHIFPGGGLLSLHEVSSNLKKHTSLFMDHVENIGADYALTIEKWQHNIEKNREAIEHLGFDEAFLRMWRYYLASTRALFEMGQLMDLQVVLTRPGSPLARGIKEAQP